ncbi:MAG: hypothetical protein JWM71_189, partial [Solirubrobacteraceae bacterium]|nr:hypothetical protein [Solirubrobacteraceae bacterium]
KGPSEIGLDTYSSSNHWDTSPAGVNIWDGQWHQLAVTYDQAADQVVAYADGNPLPAETPSTTLNLGAGSILVGNWVDHDLNKPLLGNEDEAAVYGSALSASRIAAHFQSAAGSPPAPSPTPTPPGGKHATGLSVSCTYSVATSADTCTALVGDASTDATAGQPTGTVSFASPRGLFTLGTTCNLASSPTSPSVASCSVNYLPPDMYLPTITATYNGDGQHASSSGHTQYRGANAASTYESVPTPAPNAFSKQITVSTPVSADGSSATACVLSAVPGADAAGGTERQSAALSVAELQALTRQVDQAVANVNVAVSESLQRSTGGLLQRIFNGLPADSQQRADVLRMPFFGDIGGDIGKLMRDGLPPVQPIIQQIGNLFVGDVVDSIPADPQARAEDLSQNAVRNLLDDIARIENAESARCSATSASQRAVGAVAAKRKSRRSPLARTTRKGIKAGRLKLTLHLSKRRLAKLTAHRKSARLAVVINLTMPSDLMPKGYPRAVVELVTLHRGKRHKQH